jgi:hypothetical protein
MFSAFGIVEMAGHVCSPPALYFDCQNGFRGCCTVNPCIQSEPVCLCDAKDTSEIGASTAPTSTSQSIGLVVPSESSHETSTVAATTGLVLDTAVLSDIISSTGIFVSTSASTTTSELTPSTRGFQTSFVSSSTGATPLPSASPSSIPSSTSAKTGPIVGGLFGGLAGLAGLVGLAYWCVRKGGHKFKFEHKTKKVVEDQHLHLSVIEHANNAPASATTGSRGRMPSPALSPRGSFRATTPASQRGVAF